MGRVSKSEWAFGDLFEQQPAPRRLLTVSELTGSVRRLLESELRQIWVTGEVSNLRVQSSGHIYFSLKDRQAQLQCVLFRGERVAHRELLEDGQKVVLFGDITVYEPRGQYQLRVLQVELQGLGALQAAFEQLKRKLQAEGLFAQERKRPLPAYPQRIGLITSPSGAALRDVLHVLARRHPFLELILVPCRVQGDGAARQIAAAIDLLNQWSGTSDHPLDLILVTRGGGSLEDLWAFNEEVLARAVAQSVLPLVSAVGHEIDVTICDFVADVRAATPSVAAEVISEGVHASREFIGQCTEQLGQLLNRRLQASREEVQELVGRLTRVHPNRFLETNWQLLDELIHSLRRGVRRGWRDEKGCLVQLYGRLSRLRPALSLQRLSQQLAEQVRRLRQQTAQALQERSLACQHLQSRLRLLGPESTLARGYSITTDSQTGAVIRSAAEVRSGQRLRTRLQAGAVESVVESQSSETR